MPQYTGLTPYTSAAALCAGLLAGCAAAPERIVYPLEVPASSTASTPMVAEPLPEVAAPAPVNLRSDAPLRYVVQRGDTLWDISKKFLLDSWQWPEIWINNTQVRNPHLIYPGDVLTLIYRDGRPQLVRSETQVVATEPALPVESYSPSIRVSDEGAAVPTIPLDAIRDFLRSPRMVSADAMRKAPYILDFPDQRLIIGAGSSAYVSRLPKDPDEAYALVRPGAEYRDPDSGELLGYEAIPVGVAELREAGNPGIVVLAKTQREARAGDRLIGFEAEYFASNFYPRAPEKTLNGRIISVFDGVGQIGQYQVVALNRGADDGMEPGHVLDILQSGREARDPLRNGKRVRLPDSYAGEMMVFKVEPRVSYALILSAERPIHVLDRVEKPVSRAR